MKIKSFAQIDGDSQSACVCVGHHSNHFEILSGGVTKICIKSGLQVLACWNQMSRDRCEWANCT